MASFKEQCREEHGRGWMLFAVAGRARGLERSTDAIVFSGMNRQEV